MADYGIKVEMLGGDQSSHQVNELPEVVVNHRNAGPTLLNLGTLSGGHVLHLAVATCLYNDIVREARNRNIHLSTLAVTATGGFADDHSTGITYTIDIAGDAPDEALRALVTDMEQSATIPQALRQGTTVDRAEVRVNGAPPVPAKPATRARRRPK